MGFSHVYAFVFFFRARIVFCAHHVFFRSAYVYLGIHERREMCVNALVRYIHTASASTLTYAKMQRFGVTAVPPAESGYPCGAWLGRHSEIDVILITREVAYHKGPGSVRPFVLCTRVAIHTRAHTHSRTLFSIDRLSLSLSYSAASHPRHSSPIYGSLSSSYACVSPPKIKKTIRPMSMRGVYAVRTQDTQMCILNIYAY